jgi:ligand-binding SRPBCC domain-containing protein
MEFSTQSGIYRLYNEQFLPISIDTAWRFFSNPSNLQKITPKELDFKITSSEEEDVYLGQIITYSIKLKKIFKMNWVTEIKSINHGVSFVDEQRFGPYKMWHHMHKFKEVEGGVLMSDIIHFKLPFSLIAPLIYRLIVKKDLINIFRFRTIKLEVLTSENQLQE